MVRMDDIINEVRERRDSYAKAIRFIAKDVARIMKDIYKSTGRMPNTVRIRSSASQKLRKALKAGGDNRSMPDTKDINAVEKLAKKLLQWNKYYK